MFDAGETAARGVERRAGDARLRARGARHRPPLNPIPFSVVRFDDGPEPRIDGPPAVIVMLGIVPAIAVKSPAIVGGMLLFTPSAHFSDAPVSSCIGLMVFVARTGRSAVTVVFARSVRSAANVKFATSSRSLACRCTRRRAERQPVDETYTR